MVHVRRAIVATISSLVFYRGFKKDCPTGVLEKKKVLEIYNTFIQTGNAKFLVDQIFRIFDADNNGCIDFKVCQMMMKVAEF